MQPEKPEIEIGTVSFKNQMDQIIKNFVQYWPIYDLPFDVYTAEDEENDRLKMEEKKQKEQNEAAAAGCCNCRHHGNDQPSRQATPGLPLPLISMSTFPFESVTESVDRRPSVKSDHHLKVCAPPAPSDTSHSTVPTQHVCFDEETKDDEPAVDVVIYLPNKQEETWLEEWSDLDDEEMARNLADSLDNGEVFSMGRLA